MKIKKKEARRDGVELLQAQARDQRPGLKS